MQYIILFVVACIFMPFLLPLGILFLVGCFIYNTFSTKSNDYSYNSSIKQSTSSDYPSYGSSLTRSNTVSQYENNSRIEVKGTEFFNRSNYIKVLKDGDKILLRRDLSKSYDEYAIYVYDSRDNKLGYIPKSHCEYIDSIMNNSNSIEGYVSSISKDCSSNYQLFIQVDYLSTKKETSNAISNNSKVNDMITTKIAGVTFENRQNYVKKLRVGEKVKLIREPNNKYDKNAVAVYNLNNNQLGYIPKELAKSISDKMSAEEIPNAIVKYIAGGNGLNYGATLEITFTKYTPSIDENLDNNNKTNTKLSYDFISKGVHEKRNGNLYTAKKLHLKAIEFDKTNIEAYLALGKVNYLLSDYEGALNAYSCIAHLSIQRVKLYSDLKDDPNMSIKLKHLDIDEFPFLVSTSPFYQKIEYKYNQLSPEERDLLPCKYALMLLELRDLLRHVGHCIIDNDNFTTNNKSLYDELLHDIFRVQKYLYSIHLAGDSEFKNILTELQITEVDYWDVENTYCADYGFIFLLENLKWSSIDSINVLELYLK